MNGISWLILALVVLATLIGVTERSGSRPATWVRESRVYRGGRRRAIDVGGALRGRHSQRENDELPIPPDRGPAPSIPQARPTWERQRRPTIAYTPPTPATSDNSGPFDAPGGVTVDFFQGLLLLVNAPYEGPNDALRQLRTLAEGGRQWDNGLVRLYQRMADVSDMRIDPFVSEHVLRAASFYMAGTLELVEADTALTVLLNMTLAEINERGLQVPNTK